MTEIDFSKISGEATYRLPEADRLAIIASNPRHGKIAKYQQPTRRVIKKVSKKIEQQREAFKLENGSYFCGEAYLGEEAIDDEEEAEDEESVLSDLSTSNAQLQSSPAMTKFTPPKPRTYAEIMAEVNASSEPNPTKSKQLPKLPIWSDTVRCVPNAILRSALFGISTNRKFHKTRTVIASVEGFEVRFKGEEFNQTDLDVWETLVHLARRQPLGEKIEFTAHSLLKDLGRGTSGQHHEELKEQFARLGSGWTEITWTKEKKTFAGTLVSSLFRDEETGRYVVKFDIDLLNLYEAGHTLIDWDQRQLLGKNNLSKWLHGHYATHAKPFPYKVQTLRELSGSDVAELRTFRQKLKQALDLLKSVGAIVDWIIDDEDLVHVVRPPSASQQRHLLKKVIPKRQI